MPFRREEDYVTANCGAHSFNTPVEFKVMQSWPWWWASSWTESPDMDIDVSDLLNCSLCLFFFFFSSRCSDPITGVQFIKSHILVHGIYILCRLVLPLGRRKINNKQTIQFFLSCVLTCTNLGDSPQIKYMRNSFSRCLCQWFYCQRVSLCSCSGSP